MHESEVGLEAPSSPGVRVGLMQHVAKRLVLKALARTSNGLLEVVSAGETYRFGNPAAELRAQIRVRDESFFQRIAVSGDIGLGESYMEGLWSTPDLVSVIRVFVRNLEAMESEHAVFSWLGRKVDYLRHRLRSNTVEGSRKNIAHHYDLGNEFYKLFLDERLAYSCGIHYTAADTLEQAQVQKFDRICQKLQLTPQDHLLEVGTGWGGFAAHAAREYGCRVTTTTISREQHDFAQRHFEGMGEAGKRIELLFCDYRHLPEVTATRFDKLVSIEMFEAVGREHYDKYFGVCDRMLKREGVGLIQTITIKEQVWDAYRWQSDWIKKHIFPGSELASLAEISKSLGRSTSLQVFNLEDIGEHYVLTLREWRSRFLAQLDQVRLLGFDQTFIRTWDYYLAYCEGAFHERYISDVQLMMTKIGNGQRLWGEP